MPSEGPVDRQLEKKGSCLSLLLKRQLQQKRVIMAGKGDYVRKRQLIRRNDREQRAIGGKPNSIFLLYCQIQQEYVKTTGHGGNEQAIGGKPDSTFLTLLLSTVGICWY